MGAMLCLALTAAAAGTAFAATKKNKKIGTVNFKVEGKIEIDTKIGQESIEVSTQASTYHVDSYEAKNEGFSWTMEDVPEYEVTLIAEEGYEFNVKKASDLNISGASYVSAKTENGRTHLIVTIKLPALKYQVSPITEGSMSPEGILSWNASTGAGSYEVKLFRGQTLLDGVHTTTDTGINLRELLQKAGSYSFHVRPLNKANPAMAGAWFESGKFDVSAEMAEANRIWYENANLGTWGQSQTGEWYYVLPDNTLVRGAWRKIKGEWYYFEDSSYMATGWKEWGGKWYYLDPVNGNMWKNTTTPDGYTLGIDGSMATGNAVSK